MFKHATESQVTISELMLPSHSNFSGKIHGGYILNLMDQIAFACASKHSRNYCVTASVNKVNFINPIEVGEIVTLKASINYTGGSSMVVGVRIESENIRQGTVKHCNSSYFTMVAIGDDGKPAKVPGLVLDSETSVRRFARSIKRIEQAKKRKNLFKESKFKMDDYLEIIKNGNAKIEIK